MITRTTFASRLIPPPDPVMVNVNDPVGELPGIVRVSVVEKSGTLDGTLKTPFTPAGNPETIKETCELKPFRPTTCTEYDAVCP